MKLKNNALKKIAQKLGSFSIGNQDKRNQIDEVDLVNTLNNSTNARAHPISRFRLFGISCLMTATALVMWQLPGSKNMEPDAFDIFTAPIMKAAPLVSVDDVDAAPEPLDTIYRVTVSKGDTLMVLLTNLGISRKDAHNAIQALSKVYDPRKLIPGQEMELVVRAGTSEDEDIARDTTTIQSLRVKADVTSDVLVTSSTDTGFVASAIEHPVTTELASTQGTIDSSLYVAALEAGMPQKVLGSLINIFSFDVDFQREIRVGDTFAAMYESMVSDEGEVIDTGNVLVGEMTVQGKQSRFYRHKDKEGFIDYYDEDGRSVRKALLRTPIDGARITSSFGNRKHPTLGYTKQHAGIDFGAREGTPIYAAGNGIIEFASKNGSYGNYVRIKHTGIFKTAYAHMSRFAKGIRKGVHVQQRQIIGYVGSTGRSTGPHLHYEVHENDIKVNPLGVKLPTGKTLSGNELATFEKTKAKLNKQFAELPGINKMASIAN